MPPWADSAEEVAAIAAAVFGALGVIGASIVAAIIAVIAAAVTAYRRKIKPILTQTSEHASTAAEQLTPNHGSTMRDGMTRIERTLDRLDRTMHDRITEVRADLRTHVDASDRAHSELFKRTKNLEDTQ